MSRPLGWYAWPLALALSAAGVVGIGVGSAAALVCATTVPGDVNGDGEAEAVVGEPGDDDFAGSVHVFYGTVDGLVTDSSGTARNDQLLTQSSPGVPGSSESDDLFGSSAKLADLNGDGCADLAVGSTGENEGRGSLVVFYGSPGGLKSTGVQAFTEDSLFGAGAAREGERFGDELDSGDFNADGIPDLAVSAPGEAVTAGGANQGAVVVLYGAATGLGTGATASTRFTQFSAGVPGVPEDSDGFGDAVAAGDFDGDGAADLAIGVPGENQATGVVNVLDGHAGTGLGGTATSYSQNTPGAPGVAEVDDQFGFALAGGDVTGDGRDDLAASAIGENGFRGAVSLFRGSASGLTGTGGQIWSQDSPGLEGLAGAGDVFGFSLAMGHLDNGPLADLAIGVPFDDIGSIDDAGGVNILLGTASGLSAAEAGQRFTQDTSGIAGAAEFDDGFGYSIATAAIQTPDLDSLLIAVPFETLGADQRAGAIHQLATFEFGPNPFGSVTINLDTAGVQGTTQSFSLFGLAVR